MTKHTYVDFLKPFYHMTTRLKSKGHEYPRATWQSKPHHAIAVYMPYLRRGDLLHWTRDCGSPEIGPQFPDHGTGNRAPISGKTTINIGVHIHKYIYIYKIKYIYIFMSMIGLLVWGRSLGRRTAAIYHLVRKEFLIFNQVAKFTAKTNPKAVDISIFLEYSTWVGKQAC